MIRFVTALANDMRLQVRYGLYTIIAVLIVVWSAILGTAARAVPLSTPALLPPFVVANLIITTFYFMAALVLFEKAEGVVAALAVTPLGGSEYLASKAATLTCVATVETLLIAAVLFDDVHWPRVVSASLLLGFAYACAGFVAVVRYPAMNEFLMPSSVFVTLLMLPLLAHFGFVAPSVMALHPVQPALLWMRDGSPAALAGAIFWCAASFVAARRSFDRFVLRA